MDKLPVEISPFLLLPYEEVLEKRFVCRTFAALLRSESFWRVKFQKDYPNVKPSSEEWYVSYRSNRKQESCSRLLMHLSTASHLLGEFNKVLDELISQGNLTLFRRYQSRGHYPRYSRKNYENRGISDDLILAAKSREWTMFAYLLTFLRHGEYASSFSIKTKHFETAPEEIVEKLIARVRGNNGCLGVFIFLILASRGFILILKREIPIEIKSSSGETLECVFEGLGKFGELKAINEFLVEYGETTKYISKVINGLIANDHVAQLQEFIKLHPPSDTSRLIKKAACYHSEKCFRYLLFEFGTNENHIPCLNELLSIPISLSEIRMIEIIIEHGFADYEYLVENTYKVSTIFLKRYLQQVSGSLLLRIAAHYFDLELFKLALTKEPEQNEVNIALSSILSSDLIREKARAENGQFTEFLINIIKNTQEHGFEVDLVDLIDELAHNIFIHDLTLEMLIKFIDWVNSQMELTSEDYTLILHNQFIFLLKSNIINQRSKQDSGPNPELIEYLVDKGADLKKSLFFLINSDLIKIAYLRFFSLGKKHEILQQDEF